MISCAECIECFNSWGDDPRVKSGKYHLSGCDYCNKPIYFRELETYPRNVIEKKTIYTENLTDGQFLKLQAQVHTLQENVNNLRVSKKKQLKKYNDYNIY